MSRGWTFLLVAVALAGCGAPEKVYAPNPTTSHASSPADPDQTVADQLRSGAVQMRAASETAAEARAVALRIHRALGGDAAAAIKEVIALIDGAGATMSDLGEDPLGLDAVRGDFAAADDRRKVAIRDGNDAYFELSEAVGTCRSLEDRYPEVIKVADLVSLAREDLAEAIEAFGGTVEVPKAVEGKD